MHVHAHVYIMFVAGEASTADVKAMLPRGVSCSASPPSAMLSLFLCTLY